ncbi:hypothetical protein PGT21_002058 [Puccinia graminis f. sp. tritici]|uniref:Phosphatidic acid phosphatase type 2/haloperoxidase domain-containing protein n=2 Tax=Puccinia graminis f. sp. tritici TaxID=56615 RepID=A0A5B0QHQ8_PUCGR|nr:hypothetical protein PGT21_002058 [Puccinia graminis f. sp. tritici]
MVAMSKYSLVNDRSLGKAAMHLKLPSPNILTHHLHPYESIPMLPPSQPKTNNNQQQQQLPQDRLGILPDVLFKNRSLNSSRRTENKRRIELLWSYLADWVVVILMAVIFGLLDRLHGHHREFDLNDPTIQFSHAVHERIPVPFLGVLAVVIPAVLIIICSQLLLRSSWDTHIGLLGLALSLSLSLVVTTTVKITVGRPRPDMLSRCQPSPTATNAGFPSYGLSNSSVCTAPVDSREFQDGFRSFPSGHSSTAWAGLGFLSLYLAGKLHLFDRRGHSLKVWISIAPLLGAALIAISRTMDNRHHWQDVLIGSALGALTAWFGYRFYYPDLSSQNSHRPYSPRIPSLNAFTGSEEEDENQSEHSHSSFSGDVENQLIQAHHPKPISLRSPQHHPPKPEATDDISLVSRYSTPTEPRDQQPPKLE